jgi:hypothetical protein
VSTPDYLAGNDEGEAPNPQAEAAEKAWLNYQRPCSMPFGIAPRARLGTGDRSRPDLRQTGRATGNERDALLERAMAAAPDDALVQWIAVDALAAHCGRKRCAAAPVAVARTRQCRGLARDPDPGAEAQRRRGGRPGV